MRKTAFKSIMVITSVSRHKTFNNCSHVGNVVTSEIETQSLKWNGQNGAGKERDMRLTDKETTGNKGLLSSSMGYTRFPAKCHISCPKVQSVFVFCLVFAFTIVTTAVGLKQGFPFWGVCSPRPNTLHSSQVKPGRIAVGFGLTWIFSVWGFDFSDSRVSLECSAATWNSAYQEWAKSLLSRLPTLLDNFSSFLTSAICGWNPGIASALSCCPSIC